MDGFFFVGLDCRVPDTQGVESDAAVQEHPPQPGQLQGPTDVRRFQIQGNAGVITPFSPSSLSREGVVSL
jgi:hypothetical protein